jgi:hypothetical protein
MLSPYTVKSGVTQHAYQVPSHVYCCLILQARLQFIPVSLMLSEVGVA